MKRNVLAYLLFSVLLLTACGRWQKTGMLRQLNELQAMNQADSLLTNDSLAKALASYFDDYGTPNERMLAHYLLARTYTDMGEAPQAIDEYHTAADCADTTAADCDYKVLARVHAQTAALLYAQFLPHEMIDELRLFETTSLRAGDTLSSIISIEHRSYAYEMMGKRDSATINIKDAYTRYLKYGYDTQAATCLGALVLYQTEANQLEAAKENLEKYRKAFSLTNGTSTEITLYIQGKYYLAAEKTDSAELYFRHCLEVSSTYGGYEGAYKGLYELYQLLGNNDSVAKYAVLCYQTGEQSYQQSSSEKLRQMHSQYNYSRFRLIADKKEKEASHAWLIFSISVVISCFVVVLLIMLVIYLRHKKKVATDFLNKEIERQVELKERALNDIEAIKNEHQETIILQKNLEIAKRQEIIDSLQKLRKEGHVADTVLIDNDVYERFRYLSNHPLEKVRESDWAALHDMIEKRIPNFHQSLNQGRSISDTDLNMAILVRLHFSNKEISIFLDKEPQYCSTRRKRLLKMWFGIDGSADDFNHTILNIR